VKNDIEDDPFMEEEKYILSENNDEKIETLFEVEE
jgi:hypothetical protein